MILSLLHVTLLMQSFLEALQKSWYPSFHEEFFASLYGILRTSIISVIVKLVLLELTKEEESALKGEQGEIMQMAYRILVATGEATDVSFAESNAAIHANSFDNLKTNKESAFSALASAITGKSPYSSLRKEDSPNLTIRMKIDNPNELTYGMLGFFAGKVGNNSVNISDVGEMDRRSCKALCGGMGTSGTCAKFLFGDGDLGCEKVDFDKKEMNDIHDELNTAEKGDLITLGSPQLGLEEISDLTSKLKGRSFKKRCIIFCPRTIKEQARKIGYTNELERAGCEILADCCTCLTPLINKDNVDSVTTNSIKGAYYLKNSNGVGVNLKSLSQIIEDETR